MTQSVGNNDSDIHHLLNRTFDGEEYSESSHEDSSSSVMPYVHVASGYRSADLQQLQALLHSSVSCKCNGNVSLQEVKREGLASTI